MLIKIFLITPQSGCRLMMHSTTNAVHNCMQLISRRSPAAINKQTNLRCRIRKGDQSYRSYELYLLHILQNSTNYYFYKNNLKYDFQNNYTIFNFFGVSED